MAVKGGWWWEKARRGVRTVYFMVVMIASLLVVSLPLVVAICDAVLPCLLIPSFTCVKCYGFREHLQRYAFKSSLMDIPLVSIVRSLIIICIYLLCNGQALSHGPYLGTVTFCSLSSILLLSVKACFFTVNSQLEAEASTSLSRKRLHLKKSWGMPVLFLSSVVFALGHIVVAYRTSCKARRKLVLHRIDPEAEELNLQANQLGTTWKTERTATDYRANRSDKINYKLSKQVRESNTVKKTRRGNKQKCGRVPHSRFSIYSNYILQEGMTYFDV